MYECKYILKKQIKDTVHELTLDQNEIREIWAHYEQYLTDENIWNRIKDAYGLNDFTKYEDIIDDISHKYKKCIEWGCDHEHALDEAISEHQERLEELVKQREGESVC